MLRRLVGRLVGRLVRRLVVGLAVSLAGWRALDWAVDLEVATMLRLLGLLVLVLLS